MFLAIWWLWKALVAMNAVIRLFVCVCLRMSFNIFRLFKRLATIFAFVGSFIRVRSDMSLKAWWQLKTSLTKIALVTLCYNRSLLLFIVNWLFTRRHVAFNTTSTPDVLSYARRDGWLSIKKNQPKKNNRSLNQILMWMIIACRRLRLY